jgi:hypothetical protein
VPRSTSIQCAKVFRSTGSAARISKPRCDQIGFWLHQRELMRHVSKALQGSG